MFDFRKLFAQPPSRQEFADLASRHLLKKCPTLQFTFIEDQFCLKEPEGRIVFLNNYFTDFLKSDKAGQDRVLDLMVHGIELPPIPSTLEEARPNLMPVLRSLPGLEFTLLNDCNTRMPEAIARIGMRPFVELLSVGVAYDTEKLVCQIGGRNFDDWGISAEEALSIALDNLRHKAKPSFQQVIPGTYVSNYRDSYDATRILLPELARQLSVSGNPVAMVPTRDCLVITGDADEVGQSMMLAIAQKLIDETSRHLSSDMFRLDEKTWKVWKPIGQCAQSHRTLSMSFLLGYYESQQAALVRAKEKSGEDVFVASFKAMQKPSGELFSFASLSLRLPTLLPKAEIVALMTAEVITGNAAPLMVTWEAFVEEMGPQLERMDFSLPRYRVTFDPTDEQLERLRQKAVSLA